MSNFDTKQANITVAKLLIKELGNYQMLFARLLDSGEISDNYYKELMKAANRQAEIFDNQIKFYSR